MTKCNAIDRMLATSLLTLLFLQSEVHMATVSVDYRRLSDLYRTNTAIGAIIDWLGERERDPRNSITRLRSLRFYMSKGGNEFTDDELQNALQLLDEVGCGEYQRGRPVGQSRLHWSHSAREIAAEVLASVGNQSNLGPIPVEDGSDLLETHLFPVRPGISLPVTIRTDMTSEELENMAEYVRILARSRKPSGAKPR